MRADGTVTTLAGLSLAGRVAAVVGGAPALSDEVAARLVESGAGVVLASMSRGGKAARSHLAGSDVVAAGPDAADPRLMAGIADRAVSEYGRLDVWVQVARWRQASERSTWRRCAPQPASTAWGGYLGMRAVAIRMSAGSGGVIVNVSPPPCSGPGAATTPPSMARRNGSLGLMTRTLAAELEALDVRVFSIQPHSGGEHSRVDCDGDDPDGRMVGRLPFGDGQIPSLPDAVAFCASDLSMFMSGCTLLAT